MRLRIRLAHLFSYWATLLDPHPDHSNVDEVESYADFVNRLVAERDQFRVTAEENSRLLEEQDGKVVRLKRDA